MSAGVAMLEGIQKILNPHPLESPWVNYTVLALSLVFEGARRFIIVSGHVDRTRMTATSMSAARRQATGSWRI